MNLPLEVVEETHLLLEWFVRQEVSVIQLKRIGIADSVDAYSEIIVLLMHRHVIPLARHVVIADLIPVLIGESCWPRVLTVKFPVDTADRDGSIWHVSLIQIRYRRDHLRWEGHWERRHHLIGRVVAVSRQELVVVLGRCPGVEL